MTAGKGKSEKPREGALRRKALFLLRVGVTVALAAYVLSKIDFYQFAHRFGSIKGGWTALAVSMLALQIVVAALRWQQIIGVVYGRMDFWRSLRFTWEGAFFSQLLPSAIGGDVVRIWRIHKAGVPGRVSASTVFLDRVSALVAVIIAVLLVLPVLIPLAAVPHLAAGVFALVLMGVSGLAVLLLLDRLARLPSRWFLTQFMHRLAADSRTLIFMPGSAALVVVYSLLVLALAALSLYLLGVGLGIPLGLRESFAFTPLIVLIMTLPISVAGWGVRELGMVTLLLHVGIPATDAVALSVLFGIAVLAASLPGGVPWLFRSDRGHDGGIAAIQLDPNSEIGGRP